ncbi:hypothetical protein BC827DRAFT_1383537 [Russula dissimulans]|nr:hypothetical protein BC827DRAFT_1383537 [Russula dissimulans]
MYRIYKQDYRTNLTFHGDPVTRSTGTTIPLQPPPAQLGQKVHQLQSKRRADEATFELGTVSEFDLGAAMRTSTEDIHHKRLEDSKQRGRSRGNERGWRRSHSLETELTPTFSDIRGARHLGIEASALVSGELNGPTEWTSLSIEDAEDDAEPQPWILRHFARDIEVEKTENLKYVRVIAIIVPVTVDRPPIRVELFA